MRVFHGIDRHDIPVAQQADGPAHGGLRRYMSNHESVAATREAAVGDQGHAAPQPAPHEAPVGLSISRMPGPPLGPS